MDAYSEQLYEEKWFYSLPKIEQQIVILRNGYYNGEFDREGFESAVSCELFWSELSSEEQDRLWDKYVKGERK